MARAAIVTVGSELIEGMRLDTNTAVIARALAPHGFRVAAAVSVGDDVEELSAALRALIRDHELVITTGGLGPTHDDVTREAAAVALGTQLVPDERLETLLAPAVLRHRDPEAARKILSQALVLPGAKVIDPTTGTAPGLIAPTTAGELVLLPGPPAEMRPMLDAALERYPLVRALPFEMGVAGMTESDAQVVAKRALSAFDGVSLTVLARPGDVRILLFDNGAGEEALAAAGEEVRDALGVRCYGTGEMTLEESVVLAARPRGITLATAESCTGGKVGAALTEVPGASNVYRGGVISYSNEAKVTQLGVPAELIERFGAVSDEVALAMADGARTRFGADIAVAVTGIAGPGGGSADKPVGLVWFALATHEQTVAVERRFRPSSRSAIREQATSTALDLLRLEVLSR